MRIELWDDYGRYLVMADKSDSKVVSNYAAFLEFKRILLALKKIVNTYNDQWYEFEGNRMKKIVTTDRAKLALRDFAHANFNGDYFVISKQIKAKIS